MLTAWIPRVLAILCLLALLPWLLGVPGVDNNYARGWNIGLQALVFYVLAYCILAGATLVIQRGWLAVPPGWIELGHWLAVAGFALAQAIAWPLILNG